MTDFADRLVARATDRASAVQPVIQPLFASWQRGAGTSGAPSARDGFLEADPAEVAQAGRPALGGDTLSAVGRAEPRSGTEGARRQTLDEWLTAHAPTTLTTAATRPPRAAHQDIDVTVGAAPTVDDVPDPGIPLRSAGTSEDNPQRSETARAESAQSAPLASRSRDATNDAQGNRRRNRLDVASEPLRHSQGTTPEGPSEPPRRNESPPARAARQPIASRDGAPPVQITIGRVVVRAVLPNAPQASLPSSTPAPPAGGTLAEYLARGPRR